MAIVSGIEITEEQAEMIRFVIARNKKYPDTWGKELNLVEEPDGCTFTIDDGDSILFEFVPEGFYDGE